MASSLPQTPGSPSSRPWLSLTTSEPKLLSDSGTSPRHRLDVCDWNHPPKKNASELSHLAYHKSELETSSVRSAIKDLGQLPNPWDHLPTESATKPATPPWLSEHSLGFTNYFRLLRLPNELIRTIADLLPAESTASLALVNRFLKTLLGPRALELKNSRDNDDDDDAHSKFEFLKLLERECRYLIACPFCLILHFPNAPCLRNPLETPTLRGLAMSLPKSLNYVMIRAVARHHVRGGDDTKAIPELLGLISTTKVLRRPDVRAIHTLLYRFIRGNLFLRTQTVMAPFCGGDVTSHS